MNWPDGARCAVMLTFDFDAETLWLARDPENARRPGVLSMGSYGARRGVPEILKLLGEYNLPATFFTPGWTIEKYQDRIHAILEGGHEIAHHGYLHERVDPDKPDAERESILRGLESFDKVIGKRPTGYRSPAGETTPTLMGLLHEQGILYDSSLMADIVPYRHRLADGKPGPLELPWHWGCDDAPYMMFALQAWRPQFTNQQVFENWRDEFDTIYEWNGLFNLVMHPQFIGRPMRLPLLRRIVGYIRSKPGVWFATGHQTASQWAARNE